MSETIAKVAHARTRGHYLVRSCYALDYWHVICLESAPRKR